MAARTRPPRPDERFDLQAIAAAAGLRFAEHPDPRIATRADDLPPTLDALTQWIEAGRAWVSVDGHDEPVGFLVLDIVDGLGHIEEISVHPGRQGEGHGQALLDEAAIWCVATGRTGLTLTTFSDVEWNRPYYERRGFRVLQEDEIGPGLAARMKHEAELGLVPALRVCMFRDLD